MRGVHEIGDRTILIEDWGTSFSVSKLRASALQPLETTPPDLHGPRCFKEVIIEW